MSTPPSKNSKESNMSRKTFGIAEFIEKAVTADTKGHGIVVLGRNQTRQILIDMRKIAKLAEDNPAFYNPFDIIEAKKLRDIVLAKE
jgi:hypothetical protein